MTTFQYHLPGSSETYSARVDAPSSKAKCGVLLGHGAGGDSESGNLPRIAQALCEEGILCVRFDCKPPILAKRVAHAEVGVHLLHHQATPLVAYNFHRLTEVQLQEGQNSGQPSHY